MISISIVALLALAAAVSIASIGDSIRKGFATARLIGQQLAALDAPTATFQRARPIRAAVVRRQTRRVAPALRAAA